MYVYCPSKSRACKSGVVGEGGGIRGPGFCYLNYIYIVTVNYIYIVTVLNDQKWHHTRWTC